MSFDPITEEPKESARFLRTLRDAVNTLLALVKSWTETKVITPRVDTDTIAEKTADHGVVVDGVTLKDGVVTGNVTGNLTGNSAGTHTGNSAGTHTGDVTGNVIGNVSGNLTGNVTGDVTGGLVAAGKVVNLTGATVVGFNPGQEVISPGLGAVEGAKVITGYTSTASGSADVVLTAGGSPIPVTSIVSAIANAMDATGKYFCVWDGNYVDNTVKFKVYLHDGTAAPDGVYITFIMFASYAP